MVSVCTGASFLYRRRSIIHKVKACILLCAMALTTIFVVQFYKAINFEKRIQTTYREVGYDHKPFYCVDNGSSIFLLLVVPSATGNFRQRIAIRNSWGSVVEGDPSLQLGFFVGTPRKNTIKHALAEEKQNYKDIIEVKMDEKYENLANKSISIIEWMYMYCNRAKFILKVDDDMFLNINKLIEDLKISSLRNSIIGCKVTHSSPSRFPLSKWYISRQQYQANTFPEYISGPAYIITGDILSKLYFATKCLPYIFLEDVYLTGICRRHINAIAVGHPGFSCGYRDQGPCGGHFRYKITGHHYYPEEIERMWFELNDRWYTCPLRHSYLLSKALDILFLDF